MVNQIFGKEIYPEEHRDEGPLLDPMRMRLLSERSESKDLSRTVGLLDSCTLILLHYSGCRIAKLSTELRNPLRIGALRAPNLQLVLACECHLFHASVRRRRTCTASLFSSRSASAAIHRAARESCLRIFSASRMAARFSRTFLFPIFRKAQFTAFLTKFRASWASREIIV